MLLKWKIVHLQPWSHWPKCVLHLWQQHFKHLCCWCSVCARSSRQPLDQICLKRHPLSQNHHCCLCKHCINDMTHMKRHTRDFLLLSLYLISWLYIFIEAFGCWINQRVQCCKKVAVRYVGLNKPIIQTGCYDRITDSWSKHKQTTNDKLPRFC